MVQNGRISNFHGLLTLTLNLDPGMVITVFISHRVLSVYQISSKSKKLFVDGRTDGNLPPIVLGRLPKFGSRPKNWVTTGVHFLQLSWVGSVTLNALTTRLNLTRNVQKCWKLVKKSPTSRVELRWVVNVFRATDPTQLNSTSWVELSRIGRSESRLRS